MAKQYLQPLMMFPAAAGGTCSVYIYNTTTKAALYNPNTLAPISNPVNIDSAGVVDPFVVESGITYDIDVMDSLGNSVWSTERISVPESSVYDGIAIVNKLETSGSVDILPNVLTVFGSVNAMTLTLISASSAITQEHHLRLTATASTSLSFSPSVVWAGGSAPVFTSGRVYEISVLNGLAVFAEFTV